MCMYQHMHSKLMTISAPAAPATAPRSCTNWAVIMIIILGVFFMVIPGVTLASQKIGAPTPTLRDFDSD